MAMTVLEKKIRELENYKLLAEYLPNDHSNRQYAIDVACKILENIESATVLDLGCGEGGSRNKFYSLNSAITWRGIDISESPEISASDKELKDIEFFDGENIPYPDEYFDIVYCNQVLEHARHPERLLVEANRVLKSQGWLIGSVSYLEPLHSRSIFNFTPYGVVRVLSELGFGSLQLRPGVDASWCINRQLSNRSNWLRWAWNVNYIHALLGVVSKIGRVNYRERNFLKVQFSGHIVFIGRKA